VSRDAGQVYGHPRQLRFAAEDPPDSTLPVNYVIVNGEVKPLNVVSQKKAYAFGSQSGSASDAGNGIGNIISITSNEDNPFNASEKHRAAGPDVTPRVLSTPREGTGSS